jgi:hypothetical protein
VSSSLSAPLPRARPPHGPNCHRAYRGIWCPSANNAPGEASTLVDDAPIESRLVERKKIQDRVAKFRAHQQRLIKDHEVTPLQCCSGFAQR